MNSASELIVYKIPESDIVRIYPTGVVEAWQINKFYISCEQDLTLYAIQEFDILPYCSVRSIVTWCIGSQCLSHRNVQCWERVLL